MASHLWSLAVRSAKCTVYASPFLKLLAAIEVKGHIIEEWTLANIPPVLLPESLHAFVEPTPANTIPFRVLRSLYDAINDPEQADHLRYFMVSLQYPQTDVLGPSAGDWRGRIGRMEVAGATILDCRPVGVVDQGNSMLPAAVSLTWKITRAPLNPATDDELHHT